MKGFLKQDRTGRAVREMIGREMIGRDMISRWMIGLRDDCMVDCWFAKKLLSERWLAERGIADNWLHEGNGYLKILFPEK